MVGRFCIEWGQGAAKLNCTFLPNAVAALANVVNVRLASLVGPYMDVSRKARFGGVKFQKVAALHSACFCWFYPAGPDGIRGQGSHLIFELKALDDYRIAPAPV